MGNTTSIITPQKFQEQVFSIVLYHIAPKANTGLKLIPEWEFQKQRSRGNSTADCLPLPDHITYQNLLDFYSVNDSKVSEYLNKHVLNSEENLTRFYRALIDHLEATTVRRSSSSSSSSSSDKAKKTIGGSHYSKASDRLTRSRLDEIDSRQPSLLSGVSPRLSETGRSNLSNFTKCQIVQTGGQELSTVDDVGTEAKRQLMRKFLKEYDQQPDILENSTRQSESNRKSESHHPSESYRSERSQKSKPQRSEPQRSEPQRSEPQRSEHQSQRSEHHQQYSEASQRYSNYPKDDDEKEHHSEGSRSPSIDEAYPQEYHEPEHTDYGDEKTLKYEKRFGKNCIIED